MYKLLKKINFKDNNFIEEGIIVEILEEDENGLLKVSSVNEFNLKRIFWVEKKFLIKLTKKEIKNLKDEECE